MTVFNYTLLVNDPPATVLKTALGPDSSNKLSTIDVGKGVKLSTAQNYVLCADGDEIEGVVDSVSPETVNDGFSFGGIQVNRRVEAIVGTEEVGTVDIGELVVAGAQIAAGTAGILRVKSGAPATHKWRCIRHITGTGAAGDKILLEKV